MLDSARGQAAEHVEDAALNVGAGGGEAAGFWKVKTISISLVPCPGARLLGRSLRDSWTELRSEAAVFSRTAHHGIDIVKRQNTTAQASQN